MAEIKNIYEDSARTREIYPITHEKAVIDNNGTTAETKFQMIKDLVNQKQMEVGAVPSDLTPTLNSTKWVTSGGIYNALYSPESITVFENSNSAIWQTGNVNSSGEIISSYANKYIIIDITNDYDYLIFQKSLSSYYMAIYKYDGAKYISITYGTSLNYKTTEKLSRILLLLWDKPSDAAAMNENISVISYTEEHYVRESEIENTKKGVVEVTYETSNGIIWEQGGISGNTGFEESNSKAIRTNYIDLHGQSAFVHIGAISGFNPLGILYDDKGRRISNVSNDTIVNSAAFVRFVFYGSSTILPSRGSESGAYVRLDADVPKILFSTDKLYYNPVFRSDFPDPTVWNGEDGYYYALATGGVSTRKMLRSADLVNWENTLDLPYNSTEAENLSTAIGGNSYWAPAVVKIKQNQWNMYISKPYGGVAIMSSNHPTIGYKFVRMTTAPFGDYIDAEVVRDEQDRVWMLAGSAAMMHRRLMTDDGLDFAEGSSWVHIAGRPSNETGNTNRAKTFEGECLFRRQGYWYLFMSSGQYSTANYAIRVVRCETIDGNFVDKNGNLATDGYAETIMSTANGDPLYGPGHNAGLVVDRNGKTWMLYHAHWVYASSGSARPMCLDEVLWGDDGWPYFVDSKPSIVSNYPKL